MRPLTALRARWQDVLDDVARLHPGERYRVVMVGGGAAGIESILSAYHRLHALSPGADLEFTLATQGPALVSGLSARAGRILGPPCSGATFFWSEPAAPMRSRPGAHLAGKAAGSTHGKRKSTVDFWRATTRPGSGQDPPPCISTRKKIHDRQTGFCCADLGTDDERDSCKQGGPGNWNCARGPSGPRAICDVVVDGGSADGTAQSVGTSEFR